MTSCDVETLETIETGARRTNGQQSQVSQDIVRLPFGLLGFEGVKNYALVTDPKAGGLLWLQMLEGARHSFLVTPPSLVHPDYGPIINEQDVNFLGLTGTADAIVLNIVDLSQGTVNMKAPIVINRHSRIGKQVLPKNADCFDLRHSISAGLVSSQTAAPAVTSPRRPLPSLNQRQSPESKTHKVWDEGIDFEVGFWDQFIGTKGLKWPDSFKRRMDPNARVSTEIERMLDEVPGDYARVLDVGAGPLTVFGYIHPRKKILLEATDALAKEYDVLLLKHGVVPPVRTMYAEAEKLNHHFAAGMFDLVHARNSIDHCGAPFAAICQMLAVAKIGAYVCLNHEQNEAENQKYSGFHQWNFTVENGHFIIRGKSQTFNVTQLLTSFAVAESRLANKNVNVRLRKLKDLPKEWLARVSAGNVG
ncbi:MAG TPA: flagellar assembly protein FliW [Verrucomicrobiae bacterium]